MKRLIGIFGLLLLSCALGLAQEAEKGKKGGKAKGKGKGKGKAGTELAANAPARQNPLIAVIDTNGNGILTAGELKLASVKLLQLDKDGDGKLSPEEFRGTLPAAGEESAAKGEKAKSKKGGAKKK